MKRLAAAKTAVAVVASLFIGNILHAQLALQTTDGTSSDSIVQLTAEAQGLTQIAPEDLPPAGTYWVMTPDGFTAPWPCPPLNVTRSPVYAITANVFLVDATGGQIATNLPTGETVSVETALTNMAAAVVEVIQKVQGAAMTSQTQTLGMMTTDVPLPPGGGGTNDNGGYTNTFSSTFMIDTNQLWLEITNVDNADGIADANLHKATNRVYAILSSTDLTVPLADWQVAREVWPGDTNCEPFTLATQGQDILFLRAEDWTTQDSDGDGVPDWWAWQYWGTNNVPDTNVDYSGSGNTFAQDYSNNIAPTVFSFTGVEVTNNYVNTSSTAVQLDVVGRPYYEAISVDDTNYAANANWQPYAGSNATVTLGLTEGWHDVWIGLRGHGDDPTNAIWQWQHVKLDYTPPQISVTNLSSLTVSVPLVQLQGLVNEELSRLTYDVSNADTVLTNLTGYTTELFYDANQMAFTTNSFQCYDIELTTNGANVITLHATDLAGNTTTTNLSVTVDYGTATAPVAALTWPTDGTSVGASNFVLQATVNDPTATVTVSIVDTNGDTNTVYGTVDRNGQVMLGQIPLGDGANTVTVTTTGASGLSSSTSFTVTNHDVGLTLNPLSASQQNQSSVSVSGNIVDAGYTVTVNGVSATVAGNAWSASGVPVNGTGTASFDVRVSDGSGNLVAEQVFEQYQPAQAMLASFEFTDHYIDTKLSTNDACAQDSWWLYQGSYLAGFGGTETDLWTTWDYNCADPTVVNEDVYDYSTEEAIADYAGFGEVTQSGFDNQGPWSWYYHWRSKVVVNPGGEPAVKGATKTYLVRVLPMWQNNFTGQGIPLPPEWMRVHGQTLVSSGQTNTVHNDYYPSVWGETVVQAPAGVSADITPVATQVYENTWDYYYDEQAMELNLLAVDNNRDGQITFDGSDDTTPTHPFRFWINDSQESGDISSAENATPGYGSPNYANSQINGRSDLVNFFPVALNLGAVLQECPLTNGYEYHLSQADSAVKFVYTSLTQGGAFDYLTDVTATNGYGVNGDESPQSADTIPVTGNGVNLDTDWLARVQINGGAGIVLVEGCAASTAPLNLEIWHNGQKLGAVPLYLSISGVEQMYRHLNLRDGADAPANLPGPAYSGDTGVASSMSNPANFPDELLDDKWLIFVHGYNVSAQESRGWESEMFKRFYWSGSRSKFVGVDWLGNPEGANFVSDNFVYGIPDYYLAEMNAFATAPVLAAKINALTGSKTIVSHSLGCCVTAVALNDFNLQVNHACLVDAALAQECFDGDADDNATAMASSWWESYPTNLWASHWHEAFDSSDARSGLTWCNRFTNALKNGNVYSFYSSTEDVLGEYDGTPSSAIVQNAFAALTSWSTSPLGDYAWVVQEKTKGSIASLFGITIQGSDYGGWGFNVFDGLSTNYPVWYTFDPLQDDRRLKTPSEIGTVTQDLLDGSRYNPLFLTGWGSYDVRNPQDVVVDTNPNDFTGPSWILDLYDPTNGNTVAADPTKNAQLLAQAIPALSLPVGANLTTAFNENQFNMPAQFANKTYWPRGKDQVTDVPLWHHSDLSQIAYPYVYKLFNQLVSISNQ